ncbi:MAG: tRNA 4-thiouridine(8) synthase ThiI [Endomicrobiia bacterium]
MTKCLLLFSGGLDSTVAFYILKEQGCEVIPFKITTPFLSSNHLKNVPFEITQKIVYYEAKQDYIELVLHPEYGYGRGLNPCIDCKIYMLKKAKEYLQQNSLDIIATGEVVGQRPFSQQKYQLKLIEKKTNLEDKILRPLCAKLLPPTIYEKNGIIDREKLLSISGRSRKIQIELAKKYGIHNPFSAGGCLLTDKNFVDRFKTLLEKFKNWDIQDIELLKIGRHFYYKDTKVILGRDKNENETLISYSKNKEKFFIIEPPFIGPVALCYVSRSIDKKEIYEYAIQLIKNYSKKNQSSINESSSNNGPSLHTV